MYGATLLASILLVAQDAIVTAGLMCAPEICPIEYTATSNATPWASPMNPRAAAVDPNPSASLVAVKVAGPTRVRRNVPEASAAEARLIPFKLELQSPNLAYIVLIFRRQIPTSGSV